MHLIYESFVQVHRHSFSYPLQGLRTFSPLVHRRSFNAIPATLVTRSGQVSFNNAFCQVFTTRINYPSPKTVAGKLSFRLVLACDEDTDSFDFHGAERKTRVARRSRVALSLSRRPSERYIIHRVSSHFARLPIANANSLRHLDANKRRLRKHRADRIVMRETGYS